MNHEQQLIGVLRSITDELYAGRQFEAQQIARWARPDFIREKQRQAEALYHAAINAEQKRIVGAA